MNAKRSIPSFDGPGRVGVPSAAVAAGALPTLCRAGLVFALLTGPGMLPGVYAQVDAPQPGHVTGGPVKRSKNLKLPHKTVRKTTPPSPGTGGSQPGAGTPIATPVTSPVASPVVRRVVPNRTHGVTPLEVMAYRAQMQNGNVSKPDPTAYLNALIQRERMPVTAVKGGSSSGSNNGSASLIQKRAAGLRTNIGNSTGVWFPMGPYQRLPGGDRDQGILPVAGRVNGIGYANDRTGIFYLATASGGVWKWDPSNADGLNSSNQTVDANWTHFSDTQFATPETSCVAVDPNDHRIVYVGAGDYDGAGTAGNLEHAGARYGVGYGLGIMKTVNGGATWYNIANGNPLTAAPGLTSKFGAATPIMEGTAVSAIVINPTNSKNIIATSGRGVNPGGLWYSTNSGNTWTRANIGGTTIGTGNWSSLSVSNIDGTAANLRYYASREDDGVYSSPDGVTWTKLPVPLVYNGTGNGGNVGIKVVASTLPRQNNLTAVQRVLYVADASQSKNDGRIFKSIDGGATWSDITGTYPAQQGVDNTFSDATFALNLNSSLVPVVGNSSAGSTLRTLLVDLLTVGSRVDATSTSPIEPTGAAGPKYLGTPTGSQASQVADPGASPDFYYPDNYLYPNPQNAIETIPHRISHGAAVSPASLISYLNGGQTYLEGMLLNDGGIYPTQIQQGFYGLDSSLSYLYYQSPDVQVFNPEPLDQNGQIILNDDGKPPFPTMNDDLVITQMLNGDFFEPTFNGVGSTNILVRGATVDTMIAESDDALTPLANTASMPTYPTGYQPDWVSIQNLLNPSGDPFPDYSLVSYASKQTVEAGNDQGANNYIATNDSSIYGTNPEAVSDGVATEIDQRGYPTMDTISFNPLDLTGNTQVMATSGGSGRWITGAKSLYYTTSNWAAEPDNTNSQQNRRGSTDITADQQQYIGKAGALIYLYNTTSPQDGVAGPTWQNEYHTQLGMPFAWDYAPDVTQDVPEWVGVGNFVDNAIVSTGLTGTFSSALYVGDGAYLWRFDPPGSRAYPPLVAPQPAQPLAPAPAHKVYWPWTAGPNDDRGVWRQMNTTQLAGNTADDHISAIGVVPGTDTVYVGTTTGTLWVTTGDNGRLGAYYQSSVAANYGDVNILTSNQILPKLLPTWYKIAGPGTTSNLPNRPITSINVNFDPNTTSHAYGDILVTLGGAGGAGPNGVVGRVWRATNAIGALPGVPTFTNASGTVSNQTYAYLPDVTVYQIARDTTDPTNTYYAATDVGVFSSIDAGSTWTNATAPLGLPNVACTGIKVVQNSSTLAKTLAVSTFGRGAWGFDLTNITPVISKPNLIYSSTFNRTGNTLIVNLKITDFSTAAAPAGTAFNVTLNAATLLGQTGASLGNAFTSLSNPTTSLVQSNTSATGAPILIGTIGQNQTVYVTLYFDATNIRTGTLANLQLGGSYTLPPIPPGTTTTFTNKGTLAHVP